MAVAANQLALSDLSHDLFPGAQQSHHSRDTVYLPSTWKMIKVHYARRVTALTVSAWTLLKFSDTVTQVHPATVDRLLGRIRETALESSAGLTGGLASHVFSIQQWSRLRDLNPRPTVYKTVALPLS